MVIAKIEEDDGHMNTKTHFIQQGEVVASLGIW